MLKIGKKVEYTLTRKIRESEEENDDDTKEKEEKKSWVNQISKCNGKKRTKYTKCQMIICFKRVTSSWWAVKRCFSLARALSFSLTQRPEIPKFISTKLNINALERFRSQLESIFKRWEKKIKNMGWRSRKRRKQRRGSLDFRFSDTLHRLTQPINQRYWQREQNIQTNIWFACTMGIYSSEQPRV